MSEQEFGCTASRRAAVAVAGVALLGGWIGARANSIEIHPTVYEGMDCDRLISVYKRECSAAGFSIAKETVKTVFGQRMSTIEFHFALPEYRDKPPGAVSFMFTFRIPGVEPNRAP